MTKKEFDEFFKEERTHFILGDAFETLKTIPSKSVDLVLTSPPYFNLKDHYFSSIDDYKTYLLKCFKEIKRVLNDTGSFWLNIAPFRDNKGIIPINDFFVLELVDRFHFMMINDVIWEKSSFLPISSSRRLSSSYEHFYHFAKTKDYYYNQSAFKTYKKKNSDFSIKLVKAKRKIQDSFYLNEDEKAAALKELDIIYNKTLSKEISDFRLFIRGSRKIINGTLSARNQELNEKGYFFVCNNTFTFPTDVWNIEPEKNIDHESPFPKDLVVYPIITSCPKNGIVLDPFCGSGTTNVVAYKTNRKSIGIDIKKEYIEICHKRIKS